MKRRALALGGVTWLIWSGRKLTIDTTTLELGVEALTPRGLPGEHYSCHRDGGELLQLFNGAATHWSRIIETIKQGHAICQLASMGRATLWLRTGLLYMYHSTHSRILLVRSRFARWGPLELPDRGW